MIHIRIIQTAISFLHRIGHAQVKGKDDLRQDAVIQQLYRVLNSVFAETPDMRDAGIQLRTYQVVPLSPTAGIAE